MMHLAFPGQMEVGDPDLTTRQKAILTALLEIHRSSARAVGSEMLAQEGGIPVSAASIRAELAELETMGLLARAHSSSGRIPTAHGYSYFVRALLRPAVLPAELMDEVRHTLDRSVQDVEQLLHEAAHLLSTITRQLGLAHAASLSLETLTQLELALLDGRRVLMVLHLGPDMVRTLALEIESTLDPDDLEEVASVLNERLSGITLAEARVRLEQDPELARHSAVRIVAAAAARGWVEAVPTARFQSGAVHMAEQPEFSRSVELGPILRAVESGAPLDRLLVAGIEGQVGVHVGLDADLAGCSLIAYPMPGRLRAAVGVLGPRRMNYALAFAVVEAVGSQVAERITG